MRRIIATAGALALCAGALGACGGGDTVSADEYVGSLCAAAGNFSTTLVEGQTALLEVASGDATPEEGKEELTSFFDEAASAAEDAAGQIEDAGVPDVENGEEIADALATAFDDVAAALSDARGEVESLPTDSDQAFRDAAEELSASFQDDVSSIGDGLSELGESPELESAAESNEECTSLQSGIPTP